ncbi:hypothetical protein B0I21_10551 [Sphingobacterium paludis]|uniref:Uncharacterized protein n=1 Tax=Sphingobacterium paludis TaxID=1476465 RepID=A0A4R7CXB1_9SPHI|nr:hypothetical protein B0I21_10551 [Sphingobacterium paludis]
MFDFKAVQKFFTGEIKNMRSVVLYQNQFSLVSVKTKSVYIF